MFRNLTRLFIIWSAQAEGRAQNPTHYPTPGPEPVEITLMNFIVFIILPVALFIGFLVFRRKSKDRV
jgi:hypothetical protein